MDLGQIMDAEVCQLAAGKIVEPAKPIECSVLVVRPLFGRPNPGVPVKVLWWLFVRRIADTFGKFVLNVKAAYNRYLADRTVSYQFRSFAAKLRGQSLNANLSDPIVFSCRSNHCTTFVDEGGYGLFHVDIFSRQTGMNHLQGVPMVRRGDDHGVNVLPVEQFAIVTELFRLASDFCCREFAIRLM